MPVVYVTTDLIGLVMIGIALFVIGFCSGTYWVVKRGRNYIYGR